MKPYIVAPEAESDLQQIWRYLLTEAGLAVADKIQGELVDAFEMACSLGPYECLVLDVTRRAGLAA